MWHCKWVEDHLKLCDLREIIGIKTTLCHKEKYFNPPLSSHYLGYWLVCLRTWKAKHFCSCFPDHPARIIVFLTLFTIFFSNHYSKLLLRTPYAVVRKASCILTRIPAECFDSSQLYSEERNNDQFSYNPPPWRLSYWSYSCLILPAADSTNLN